MLMHALPGDFMERGWMGPATGDRRPPKGLIRVAMTPDCRSALAVGLCGLVRDGTSSWPDRTAVGCIWLARGCWPKGTAVPPGLLEVTAAASSWRVGGCDGKAAAALPREKELTAAGRSGFARGCWSSGAADPPSWLDVT